MSGCNSRMTATKLRLVWARKWKHRFSDSLSLDSSRSWTGLCQTFLRQDQHAGEQLWSGRNVRDTGDIPLNDRAQLRRVDGVVSQVLHARHGCG